MLVFVTGATGFIGSATIPRLLARGHCVLGLTRSEAGAAALKAAGATPLLGALQDLVTGLIQIARETGISAYVGDGGNVWSAVHRDDAAELCALAMEKAEAGARWRAVAEEGVALRAIAEAIGRGLGVPTISKTAAEAFAHFSWLGHFISLSAPASSDRTQETLGWRPRGIGLIEDVDTLFAR